MTVLENTRAYRYEPENDILVVKSQDKTSLLEISGLQLFLYADEKGVDVNTVKAIDESSLVIDSRLVIDKHFRTKDPYMYRGLFD